MSRYPTVIVRTPAQARQAPVATTPAQRYWSGLALGLLIAWLCAAGAKAADHPADAAGAHGAPVKKEAAKASATADVGEQVRAAAQTPAGAGKRLTLVVNGREKKYITIPAAVKETVPAQAAHETAAPTPAPARRAARPPARHAQSSSTHLKSAALAGHDQTHWSYEGETGPQAWGKLKPEFNVCALGKRQSPINIEDSATLQGPAEALVFNYQPSSGTVVNNGHTIQVDVTGDNSVTVRGSSYKLLQFHFHHPSEERINFKGFAMVAHLVHKNAEGQLAVVAVLLEPGVANALINKVWTYMPLDAADRVRMPADLIDLRELLPKDQRYFQFLGSLTTPPCSEGVLWLVLKQPSAVSREQIKLFSQLFPNNARPVQPVNGRAVREAQ